MQLRSSGCGFCLTSFVYYECLIKPRKKQETADQELQRRLIAAMEQKEIEPYSIDIADLQEVIVLENRKRVSKGELSSIAFAKKTRQAFLTDDQGAESSLNCRWMAAWCRLRRTYSAGCFLKGS